MSELNVKRETPTPATDAVVPKTAKADKPIWETPKLEDVSEEVMAQPYIRFT